MKELRSIFFVLLLIVAGFVLYKVLPAYWADYKLGRMLDQEAIVYTYHPKTDPELPAIIAGKADECGVTIGPENVTVERGGATLGISVSYYVKIDMPVVPFIMHFTTSTTNRDVMAK